MIGTGVGDAYGRSVSGPLVRVRPYEVHVSSVVLFAEATASLLDSTWPVGRPPLYLR